MKYNFHISQPKHMFCLLKRTVSMRQFFWAPKTYVKTDGKKNIHNLMLKSFIYLNLWVPILWIQCVTSLLRISKYSKTCVKRPLSKRPKIGFQDQLSHIAGHKYCRMVQGEHSAILSTFIKLPFVIKIFVLSIFELPFYTGFTVLYFEFS